MAIHAEVSTLEVAIKSSAGTALGNLDSLIRKLEELTVVLERAVSKSEGLANIGKTNTKGITNTSKGAKETEKTIKSMNTQMDKFVDKMNKTDFTGIEKSAKSAHKVVKDYADEMRRFGVDTEQKGMKFLYGEGAETRKRQSRILSKAANGYQPASVALGNDKGLNQTSQALSQIVGNGMKASQALAMLKQQLNGVQAASNQMSSGGGLDRFITGIVNGLDKFADKVVEAFRFTKTFASYLGGTLKAAFNVLKTAINGVRNAVSKMSAAFKSALGHIKSFAHGLAHPIATLKSMFGMGGGHSSGLLGGLLRGRSLGQFIGLIVLRRAVMAALRAIVNGIKEGFENIRNYSSAINSEMNSIENSLLYVKNAWAAAFAPIVSVVRPYINYLLDAIAAALNAIGRLMALLTGKGFAVQAVKLSDAMYEAGKAGNAAAGGTSKAAKAAEDYKKTIMSFDQLHVLNAQDSGSGGSGGGGGGGGGAGGGLNVNDMFTTVSLAGAFKDAIDAEDWEELGRLMAEKVNSAFLKLDELISWENIGDKITKKITALTTTLNSLVDNINWEQIGRTFGSGINTLVNTWNLFFDNFDFVNLGTKIAEGVNGLFNRVDWNELGRAVTQKFKALWETISGFVKTLNWGAIGTSIGEFLNGALKNISLPDIGATIGRAVSGLAIAIKDFTLTFDWDEAVEQVKGFIVNLLKEINASDLLDSISELAGKIVGGLSDVLSDAEVLEQLKTFASKIGEKLGSLEWVGYLADLALAIVEALEKLLSGLLEGFVAGLLIKMGVSPEKAQEAFADKDAFETYNLTGDARYLPGGEFYNKAKVQEVTALYTHAEDNLTKQDKTIYGITVVEQHGRQNLPQEDMTLYGFNADLSLFHDGIKPTTKKVNGFNALLVDKTDKLTAEQKKINNFWALTTQFRDNIKAKDKTINNATANANKFTNTVADKDKKINVNANATKFNNSLGYRPSIDVTAKIVKLNMIGGLIGNAISNAGGGVLTGGGWKPITRYASGGNPQSAELFMAREAGPELVGRLGSRTAVMNNDQIVSSVADGVKRAVIEGMAVANSGNSGSAPYEIHLTVKTQNDEVLARAVERGNAKRKYRLGTAMG